MAPKRLGAKWFVRTELTGAMFTRAVVVMSAVPTKHAHAALTMASSLA